MILETKSHSLSQTRERFIPGPFAEAHKEIVVWNYEGGVAL